MNPTPERKKISVLIPVLEPSEELALVHEQAAAEIDKLGVDCEFLYLVSPESASLTDQIRELQRKDPQRIGVIQVRHSVGGAGVLSAGIEEAEGDVLFTLPPCFEVEFSVIPKLYEAIEAGADLAIAGRSPREGTAGRVQSRIFNKLIAWASGTDFTDITSDTRAIRREVTRTIGVGIRHLHLVGPGGINKTTSGKLARRATRARYPEVFGSS